jgi:hypothetical protein
VTIKASELEARTTAGNAENLYSEFYGCENIDHNKYNVKVTNIQKRRSHSSKLKKCVFI